MFTISIFTSFDNFQVKKSSTNQIVLRSMNVGALSRASEKHVNVWIVVAGGSGEEDGAKKLEREIEEAIKFKQMRTAKLPQHHCHVSTLSCNS